MENILSHLIFSAENLPACQIKTWLTNGFYPFSSDYQRNKIIVFNMTGMTPLEFIDTFQIEEWTYGEGAAPPKEYVELFRHIDTALNENILAYRWFTAGKNFNPFPTMSDTWKLLDKAFKLNGYNSWCMRYYLTRGIVDLDAATLLSDRNSDNCCTKTVTLELQSFIHKELNTPIEQLEAKGLYPDLKARVWIDRNPYNGGIKRVYIGYFATSSDFINTKGRIRDLECVISHMHPYLRTLSISYYMHKPELLANFNRFASKIAPSFNSMTQCFFQKYSSYNKNSYISSTIMIPFQPWEDIENFKIPTSFPYAIDKERNMIIILNGHHSYGIILRKIIRKSLIRVINFSKRELPEYKDLYDFCEKQIEANLQGFDVLKWLEGANVENGAESYRHRRLAYANLCNLDPNNLPEVKEPK